jgi:hypothetical protein
MAITSTFTVNNKYRQDDLLVTDITIEFSGDITATVDTTVFHFRPETVEEVDANIENRIITEKEKILAQQKIDQLIENL